MIFIFKKLLLINGLPDVQYFPVIMIGS